MTYAASYAWRRGAKHNPRRSFWTVALCSCPRERRAGYDGAKRKKGSKTHKAVDTLGDQLTLLVTPANEQDRDQMQKLTQKVQEVTGKTVEMAFVDEGYTQLL